MNRKTILTLGAVTTAAILGAVAIPAVAAGGRDGCDHGSYNMQGHGGPGMGQDRSGPRAMMQRMQGGPAGFAGPGAMGSEGPAAIWQDFDADGDGTVTADEAAAGVAAKLAAHDADANGTLSAEEFAALVAEAMRPRSDRPFAMLDNDGDGELSLEELQWPARMMARMHDLAPKGQGKGPAAANN